MVSERLQELAGAFSPGFQEKRGCATLVSSSSDPLTKGVRGGELFAFGARLGMVRQKRIPGCHRSPISDCRVALRQTRSSIGCAVHCSQTRGDIFDALGRPSREPETRRRPLKLECPGISDVHGCEIVIHLKAKKSQQDAAETILFKFGLRRGGACVFRADFPPSGRRGGA